MNYENISVLISMQVSTHIYIIFIYVYIYVDRCTYTCILQCSQCRNKIYTYIYMYVGIYIQCINVHIGREHPAACIICMSLEASCSLHRVPCIVSCILLHASGVMHELCRVYIVMSCSTSYHHVIISTAHTLQYILYIVYILYSTFCTYCTYCTSIDF